MPFVERYEVEVFGLGLCAAPTPAARLGRFRTGNMEINPHIGILFIDFNTGDTLQLTGTGSVLWDERNLPGVPCLTSSPPPLPSPSPFCVSIMCVTCT